jgi:HK97 family phage prohead protease
MKNQKRYAKALVKEISETDGLLISVVGSTSTVDRYGESIDQKTWILDSFKKNPVILWAHNLTLGEDRPPIAKAVNVEIKKNKLVFDIQFDMADPFAADIFRKYKEKFLNAFSVGFISHKVMEEDDDNPPVLMDNELLELSAVPVPANPEALQALKKRSFAVRSFKSMIDEVEEKDVKEAANSKKEVDPAPDPVPTPEPVVDPAKPVDPTPEPPKEQDIPPVDNPEKGEDGGGTAPGESPRTADPENPSLQSRRRVIAVIREATRQFQQILSEENAARRAVRKTPAKGNDKK